MQFLFGMMMIELIVKLTLGWARMMLWLAKRVLRMVWVLVKSAWPMARRTIAMAREARARQTLRQERRDHV